MNGFIAGLAGGALIGISSLLLLLVRGRIAGISGITGGILSPATNDKGWRVLFLLGLALGGLTLLLAAPTQINPPTGSIGIVITAGLLVGFGVALGNGCTSGHGVCGVSRFSIRSIVATATFVGTGMLTATLLHGGV